MSRYDLKKAGLFIENEFSKDSCNENYDNLSVWIESRCLCVIFLYLIPYWSCELTFVFRNTSFLFLIRNLTRSLLMLFNVWYDIYEWISLGGIDSLPLITRRHRFRLGKNFFFFWESDWARLISKTKDLLILSLRLQA